MEEFQLYFNTKVEVWKKDTYLVNANSLDEAVEFLKNNNDSEVEGLQLCDSEYLEDEEEYPSLDENGNQATESISDDDYDDLWNNETDAICTNDKKDILIQKLCNKLGINLKELNNKLSDNSLQEKDVNKIINDFIK